MLALSRAWSIVLLLTLSGSAVLAMLLIEPPDPPSFARAGSHGLRREAPGPAPSALPPSGPLAALAGNDADAHLEALDLLFDLDEDELAREIPDLVPLLASPDEEVREEIAHLLGRCPGPSATCAAWDSFLRAGTTADLERIGDALVLIAEEGDARARSDRRASAGHPPPPARRRVRTPSRPKRGVPFAS